jgi:hypothetical protein
MIFYFLTELTAIGKPVPVPYVTGLEIVIVCLGFAFENGGLLDWYSGNMGQANYFN